jgi:hypothetical protein
MAHIDQTVLNTLVTDKFQEEIKTNEYGLIDFAVAETQDFEDLTPSMKRNIETVYGIDVKVPAIKDKVIVTASAESFTIPSNLAETALTTLTFITIFAGFRMYPRLFENNFMTPQEYEMKMTKEVLKAIANAKEAQIYSNLNTQKTQVWAGDAAAGSNFTFSTVTDQLTIASAGWQSDLPFSKLKTMFAENNKKGEYRLVASEGIEHILDMVRQYGSANDRDLQTGRNIIPQFWTSQNVTNASGNAATGFMVRKGSMALVQNFKPEYIAGDQVGEAKWGVSDGVLPWVNARLNLYENKEKADASSVMTTSSQALMSWYIEKGFMDRFTLINTYNSALATQANDKLKVVFSLT